MARFGKYLALGGLLAGIAASLYLLITPKTYQATTDLKIEIRFQRTDLLSTNAVYTPRDPEAVPRELRLIRSETILNPVMENLHLAQRWGERYKQGAVLTTNETRLLFHQKTTINLLPDSAIIRIRVTSEDPEETATIANEISRVYRDYRANERKVTTEAKIETLRKQWEAHSQTLIEAQDLAKKLRYQILMAQSTNPVTVIDPEGLVRLQQKRIELETDYVKKQNLLQFLKSLDHDKLRQVFPTMTTNEMVSKMMDQVSAAEAELTFAKTNSGPASSEAKHAADTLAELNKRADAIIDTALEQKVLELASTKAELDKTIDLLKRARSSNNKITIEDPAYNKAVADVQKLQLERDQLKSKLDREQVSAVLPPISSEVLAPAHPPSEPISPNRPAAIKTIWGGLAITVCGLFLIILGKGLKPETGSSIR